MNLVKKQDLSRTDSLIFPHTIAADLQPQQLQDGMFAARPQHMTIEKAHQRSAAYGLTQGAAPDFSPMEKSSLAQLLEQNRVLYTHALPVMEILYEQIINTHNMVILSDANGLILHSLGDNDFLEKADRVALKPGVLWSEESKGTNAVGTAIFDRLPTLVHANEHYLRANHFMSCSAAPIFDDQNNLIGVLDVSGNQRSFHQHTMALVRMSAQMIENQLFLDAFQDAITLHFNTRPEFIGTLMEGIVSFTAGGRFLSANRIGLFQLGLPLSALQLHTVSSLFGLPVSALYDHYRTAAPGLLELCLVTGVRVYGRAKLRLAGALCQHASSVPGGTTKGAVTPTQPSEGALAAPRSPGLHYLNTGDPQLAAIIDKVNKVLGRDIPILLMGETGTGKELLAQAIHSDSPRAHGPFVAVNCASIPETLFESELFGYEEGAFTGARKKGSIGKIMQACGGTLFLDEIGDMPPSMQARMLRVLQERMVTPLGSTASIPVNVDLICATNRNLRQLMAKGGFREDLYYRLNGLVVTLPPLRERTDLEIVINRILAAESRDLVYTVAPEIMKLFKRHNWPGNFRQLTNLLRTAVVMSDKSQEIGLQHMPDDFLEDVALSQARDSTNTTEQLNCTGANLNAVGTSLIRKSLASHRGNVSATARALGVSRNTVYRKMPQP